MFYRFIFLTASIFLSCKGNVETDEALPAPKFYGINTLKLDEDKFHVIGWKKPSTQAGQIRYQVYGRILNSVPEEGTPAGYSGVRSLYLVNMAQENLPEHQGELIGEVLEGVTSMKVYKEFPDDVAVAFQVKAVNEEGVADENNRVILMMPVVETDFLGCLDHRSQPDSITLNFEFPEDASKVNIYRGGQVVYSSSVSDTSEFTDTDVNPGQTYEYICEAEIGENRVIGSQIISASTENPIANYRGCSAGKALGASEISLSFSIPEEAAEMRVLRDGKQVFRMKLQAGDEDRPAEKTIIDRNLKEAVEYRYICEAVVGELQVGGLELAIETLSSNPPTFAGIEEVKKIDPHTVELIWGVTSGVEAASFQLFSKAGEFIDFSNPTMIVEPDQLKESIGGLGDELTYSFAVRACSVENVCDTNQQIISVQLDDGGPPNTIGITDFEKVDKDFFLIAPWKPSDGKITKRRIFRKSGGSPSNNLNDYQDYGTSGLEVLVEDPLAPPTRLQLASIAEFTDYHFILQDFDDLTSNGNTTAFTIKVGDLTAPLWLEGLTSVVPPADVALQESSLELKFNGIVSEAENLSVGADSYLLYMLHLGEGLADDESQASACSEGDLMLELPVAEYPAGQEHGYILQGLLSRNSYSFCMKARDAAGNISNTNVDKVGLVQDNTPPEFAGVQGMTVADGQILILWTPSQSADLGSYQVKFWTEDDASDLVEVPAINNPGPNMNFIALDPQEYQQLAGGGGMYALVNACDQFLAGKENCTAYEQVDAAYFGNLPDLMPPANFPGIETTHRGEAEGEIIVTWGTPSIGLDDYAGFAIYDTDSGAINPNVLDTCVCLDNDCEANNLQSCSVFLEAGRPYNLTVRAFDNNSNFTPFMSQIAGQVYSPDFSAPNFPNDSASIGGVYSVDEQAIQISFLKASDNQYDKSIDAISYRIFRTVFPGSVCDSMDINDIPALSENLLVEKTFEEEASGYLSYRDTDLKSTHSYLYRVEAKDQASINVADNERNATLDEGFVCVESQDLDPPLFVGGEGCIKSEFAQGCPAFDRVTEDAKEWLITWDMEDSNAGGTPKEDLGVKVYRLLSDDAQPPKLEENLSNLPSSGFSLLETSQGSLQYPSSGDRISGPANQNHWVHYVVVIQDYYQSAPVNKVWAMASIYSENLVEVRGITRTEGLASGGSLVVIEGSGFNSATKVYFKDNSTEDHRCVSEELVKLADYDEPQLPIKKIVCTTPAWNIASGDSEDVRIMLEVDGSTYLSAPEITYKFYNYGGSSTPDHICDDVSLDGETAASGDGSEEDPYMVCNTDQLANVLDQSLNSIQLMDHLDMTGVDWSAPHFKGKLDGQGYAIYNHTAVDKSWRMGLINHIFSPSEIKNLSLLSAKISLSDANLYLGGHYGRLGVLAAEAHGNVIQIQNVHVSGEVSDLRTQGSNQSRTFMGLLIGLSYGFVGRDISLYGDVIAHRASNFNDRRTGGMMGHGENANIDRATFVGKLSGAYIGGLAGIVRNSTIKNVKAHHIQIENHHGRDVGGIAGHHYGGDLSITGVYTTGNMASATYQGCGGGVLGYTHSNTVTLDDVHSSMRMVDMGHIGGLICTYELRKEKTGIIKNSSYTGTLISNNRAGGLIANLYLRHDREDARSFIIKDSVFDGEITGLSEGVGGALGWVDGWETATLSIDGFASLGKITSTKNRVAGVIGILANVGNLDISIKESFVSSEIKGPARVGGFVGEIHRYVNSFVIENSMSAAHLIASKDSGGFIGYNYMTTADMEVKVRTSYSRATYELNAAAPGVGGLMGYNWRNMSKEIFEDSHFDAEQASENIPNAIGSAATEYAGLGKEAIFFSSPNSLAAWDQNIWVWEGSYPSLIRINTLLAE